MVDAGRVVATLELDTGGFMDGIEGALEAVRGLSGRARSAAAGLGALSDAFGALGISAEGGADAALDALSPLAASAPAVGRAAVNGLIAGAESRRGALIAKFQALARAAVQATRSELGIASPSKVFAEIGAFAGRGFELGVERSLPAARESMRRLTALSAQPSATAAEAGVVNNHYAAPVTVSINNPSVRSDSDLYELERRTQRLARDLQYGLGV